jgi:hypothetical protein
MRYGLAGWALLSRLRNSPGVHKRPGTDHGVPGDPSADAVAHPPEPRELMVGEPVVPASVACEPVAREAMARERYPRLPDAIRASS